MQNRADQVPVKPLKWVGSAKSDLIDFPDAVRKEMGHALYLAQLGMKSPKAKPMHGFGGAGVLEIVEDDDGSAYRAIYTVKFHDMVFVLHAFQKKSHKGSQTSNADMALIKKRLKAAQELFQKTNRSTQP